MTTKNLTFLTSFLTFLYSLTLLVSGKSYSYIAILLCIISLLILPITLKNRLPSEFYKIGFSFICYALVTALSLLILGGKLSNLDMPSRTLFILPAFILLLSFPPKKEWVFIGILTGSFISGLIALYHYQVLHIRAFDGFGYMIIQSGNIAMSLGIFSLIIAIQHFKDKKSKLVIIALICAFFGILASMLSGSRGSWIIAPFVIIWLLIVNRQLISVKVGVTLTIILMSSSLVSYDIVDKRIKKAVQDITQYSEQNNSNSSLGARIEMWKSGVYNFIENPIFGTGYKDRQKYNQALVDKKLVAPIVLKFGRLHNSYIEELSIKGIIGLTTLMLFFCSPLYFFIAKRNVKNSVFAQLGIAHIILVMGYCLTQNYINHHSGMLHYLMYTIIFYAVFFHTNQVSVSDKNKVVR
ncbi:O-antigen ligase family protein [Psychromonas arctica]|uniref:O-antigen ligase family protein n=1 Tax=Psychromonas arctica TaxID=168275 RepID=UPI000425B81D|nr:O-antigen ligase family protein [Psychromonas arctica]